MIQLGAAQRRGPVQHRPNMSVTDPSTSSPPRELLCRACKGSGVCTRCNASGQVRTSGVTVRCLVCSGSTVCPVCRGTGWVAQPLPTPPPAC